MSIKLRENENIKSEVNFHWSAFLVAKLWAGVGVLAIIGNIVAQLTGDTKAQEGSMGGILITSVICFGPFLYKWLQNKSKSYVVTNQRVYVEEGILSKSKIDLPLNKVNDVSMKQGILQRMFGSGNIMVLTGNDKPTIIKDVDNPDVFKNSISEMAEKKAS